MYSAGEEVSAVERMVWSVNSVQASLEELLKILLPLNVGDVVLKLLFCIIMPVAVHLTQQ